MTTYTCTVCYRTFTTTRDAQRHAKGRGHLVLIDHVLEPTNTERTP